MRTVTKKTGWYYHNERRTASRRFWHIGRITFRVTKLEGEPYISLSIYRRGMFGDESFTDKSRESKFLRKGERLAKKRGWNVYEGKPDQGV